MRLVIICGQPASGKSTIAAQLAAGFHDRSLSVQVVDEPSLQLSRAESYKDVVSEKNTRGSVRSCVDRALAGQTPVVILDSLNNIKGYRYELWCLGRAVGARYCMVHVDTPVSTCREWNKARAADQQYPDAVFEDLASRFEMPDSRNRWDSPLFTIKPLGDPGEMQEALQAVIAAMSDDTLAVQGGSAPRDLQPTTATSTATLQATNVLHEMDRAVQEVIDTIVEAQSTAGGSPAGRVRLCRSVTTGGAQQLPYEGLSLQGDGSVTIQLDQVVTMAELRRHKRAFLKLATKITFARLSDADAAWRMFVDYLVDQVQGCSLVPRASLGAG